MSYRKKKKRLIDSVYSKWAIDYAHKGCRAAETKQVTQADTLPKSPAKVPADTKIAAELGLAHQLFFAANNVNTKSMMQGKTDSVIGVSVAGFHKVSANDRLPLVLTSDCWITGIRYPKNNVLYGMVSFAPNRVLLDDITHIKNQEVQLNAYDLQDGSEGIYIENSFRQQASREVMDKTISSVNIPSLPQLSGLKNLFRKSNRNVKVAIADQYQLVLKPTK